MKKVKVYIVTYKNAQHLNENLRTLFESYDASGGMSNIYLEVNIINNHSDFSIYPEFDKYHINILHNQTRPDFSVGHLPRDWNAALVNGFVDLNKPDCDVVIVSQDDTMWFHKALQHIVEQTYFYDFISLGNGDCVCAFTPVGVKQLGLWDETNFSSNGFHECDMFLRAALYLGNRASINDVYHQLLLETRHKFPPHPYLWNQLPYTPNELIVRPASNSDKNDDKDKYSTYHSIAREAFKNKWGMYPELEPLSEQVKRFKDGPLIKTPILYPYFEKDLSPEILSTTNWVDSYKWWR